jgi:DNA-binding NtrC family response regulator
VQRNRRILVVDDDAGVRQAIGRFLHAKGFEVVEAGGVREAEKVASSAGPDLAIVDQRLPDGTGIELLPKLRAILPQIPFVVLTAHGTIDLAVQAMKRGADQFLTKPVDMNALFMLLTRLLEGHRNRQKQLASRPRPGMLDPFLGTSPAMRRLAAEAEEAREADRPVLVLGETGTGKGVLARWLHDRGPRAEEPFVDLNCAGMSRELLDAELFGHEVGAFTGAVKAKLGLLEVAHRGSVFLDEVGDMDVGIQSRLLKVLEEKRFRRLGDVRDRFVDIRLIAATHQDLERLISAGRFREDLYYRISTLELRIPALRERPEDVPLLARHILGSFAREIGRDVPTISKPALAVLQAHPWPGNVRELRNVLETATLRSRSGTLEPEDLRLHAPGGARTAAATLQTLADVERQHIRRTLASMNGHVARTARALGISTSSLYEKIKRLGLGTIGRRRGGRGQIAPNVGPVAEDVETDKDE